MLGGSACRELQVVLKGGVKVALGGVGWRRCAKGNCI